MRKLGRFLLRVLAVFIAIVGLLLNVASVGVIAASNNYANMVSMFLSQKTYEIKGGSGANYYTSSFATVEEMAEEAGKVSLAVEQEGIILLQNNNDVLPLKSDSKVTLLGAATVEPVYSGAGAGAISTDGVATLKESMEDAGFEVNGLVWDFYDTGAASSFRRETKNDFGAGNMLAHDAPLSMYTDDIYASFDEYGDAAIVCIGRSGTESYDLEADYLTITPEEIDLIKMARDKFDKVVVIINALNTMELGPVIDAGVDAIVWTGAYGETGIAAVGQVLNGEINPSGHTVDTWAYSALSAPSTMNLGDYNIVNSNVESGDKYLVYEEGIYVGYRYYETRYEDAVMKTAGVGDFDYDSTVLYPFGYGLSYTDFEWSNYSVNETADSVTATITVTNIGDKAGKDTVELYMQSPYTDYDKKNKLEKSAVELVGFAKTPLLEAGQSATVSITVDKRDMAAYDAYGYGTYILEAGDYYFAAAKDAHDATNSILAAKGYEVEAGEHVATVTVADTDTTSYAKSLNGTDIVNQFADCDITTYDDSVCYLTRSDWEGTFPTVYADGAWNAPAEVLSGLEIGSLTDKGEAMPEFDTISETYGRLTMADMIGLEYDDPKWDALLSQMSVDETWDLIAHAGYGTKAVESITLPGVTQKDGTSGISSAIAGGDQDCTGYPPEIVMASTWDQELAHNMGLMVGEDSIASGIAVWYAPAMNIHRNPISGRNYEYYSEDGFLSGAMATQIVSGAVEKGTAVTIKHFAINDQETNRTGCAVFFNEQAAREIYLLPFEMCVEKGDANGLMDSMNRVGTKWSGANENLMINVLRNEWGYKGFTITDQASFSSFNYEDIFEAVGTTDLWLCTAKNMWNLDDAHKNATYLTAARNAAHNYLYVIANSNAMNGVDKDTIVKNVIPKWQKLYGALVIFMILLDLLNYWLFTRLWWNKAARLERKERKRNKKANKKSA